MKTLKRVLLIGICCCALLIGITRMNAIETDVLVFVGFPTHSVKVNVKEKDGNFIPSKTEELGKKKSAEYKCLIIRRGNKYYWKSREYKELERTASTTYVTFSRSNGDHITILKPSFYELLGIEKGDIKYIEHITEDVWSVNYMGDDTFYVPPPYR